MNFFNYIEKEFKKLGIPDIKEIILLPLNTYIRPDKTIEYDIPNEDNSPLDNYYYIFGGHIEDYGIDLIGNFDGSIRILSIHHDDIYLEKNINWDFINEPDIEIDNNIKHLTTTLNFTGTYNGEYSNMNIIDLDWPFYVILHIQGIKSDNHYFNKYSNSLGKLLDCVEYLSEKRLEISFNCAYTALELLIKQIKSIDYLTPKETKSILIDAGFDKYKAKKIRIERNDNIHPSEYGFFKDEEELQTSLEYTLKAYFYFFNKYCD